MSTSDHVRLKHILDEARLAMSFLEGRKVCDLDRDPKLLRALERSLELIGEAANHVSEPCRQRMPQIPWQDVVGLRIGLAHIYFDIEPSILWGVAKD